MGKLQWGSGGGVVRNYGIMCAMRLLRNFKTNQCCHLISRIANLARTDLLLVRRRGYSIGRTVCGRCHATGGPAIFEFPALVRRVEKRGRPAVGSISNHDTNNERR